jgi:hypothetical protein
MAINLGTEMVKGLYNKSNRWQGTPVTAPLPPPDNMPWGALPQTNPAYIDPRASPNTAGFPLPRGPSLPQGAIPPERPMMPMQQAPILGPSPPSPKSTAAASRRPTIGKMRKSPSGQPPEARPSPLSPGHGAGDVLLRMMHGEPRGGEA